MRVMALDPTVQVAFVGVFTSIIASLAAVFVAIINNRKERVGSAEKAMESTLRERIILRDEQIEDLKKDISDRDHTIEKLREELLLYKDGRLL